MKGIYSLFCTYQLTSEIKLCVYERDPTARRLKVVRLCQLYRNAWASLKSDVIFQQLRDRAVILAAVLEFKLKCGEKAQLEVPTIGSKDFLASANCTYENRQSLNFIPHPVIAPMRK